MTPRALAGLTVLDLATFVAAPFCSTLLGEFGAEVIKVEQPGVGDDLRRLRRKTDDGNSYWWLVEARNKKSITCDLRDPEGQALAAEDVPSSLVMSVRDLFEDAQVRARGNILSLVAPLLGTLAMPGVVPRLTLTPGTVRHPGPSRPGQDNEEVYGSRLGLSTAELARLRERKVI